MALPRELVEVMQLTGQVAGQAAADGGAPSGNLAAAAALVGDFATESATQSLERLLRLCDEGGDIAAAKELAAEATDRAGLLDAEVGRFMKTAKRI